MNNILEEKVALSSIDFDITPIDYIDVVQQLIKENYILGVALMVLPTSDDWTGAVSLPHTYTEDDIILTLDNPRVSYDGLKFLAAYKVN